MFSHAKPSGLVLINRTERGSYEVGCSNCRYAYYSSPDGFLKCRKLNGALINGQFGCKGYAWAGQGTETIRAYRARMAYDAIEKAG
jgi:hypothetical protein